MTINYRKTYLTDGTQVKITEELYTQLRRWELEGYEFNYQYIDQIKTDDNEMINANRNYYIHNISLNREMLEDHINPTLLHDKKNNIDDIFSNSQKRNQIIQLVNLCSDAQKRRFIKYYYLGFSYVEIARQERCNESAVRKSVRKVEKKIILQKTLL